jgi:hypothetical protein
MIDYLLGVVINLCIVVPIALAVKMWVDRRIHTSQDETPGLDWPERLAEWQKQQRKDEKKA